LSTILDALRKVERETAQRAQPPTSLADSSLARVLAEKRNRKVFRRLVVVITILFLAGTGVAITLGNRLFSFEDNVLRPKVAEVSKKDREIKSSTVPLRQGEETPKSVMVAKKPDPEPERQIKEKEPLPLRPRTETGLPLAAKTSGKPEPEPERLSKKEEPITLPPRIETALTVMDEKLQKPPSQTPPRSSSPIEPRRSETIIRDLELQAIVWSEDPQSCSAMINGSLVRLGGEIGGFTVEEIGHNYVYVKSGLRSGKVRMVGAR
jgi:hypothetical protein